MTRVSIDVSVRWSDLDAYEHVNNARLLTLLEEARISAFWAGGDGHTQPTAVLDTGPGAAQRTLIAAQRVEYLRPIPHLRRPLEIQLWIGRMGGASLEVHYEVLPPSSPSVEHSETAARDPYALAATTLVLVDAATGAPTRIPPDVREVWQRYTDAPLAFRA